MTKKTDSTDNQKVAATNRKARFEYFIMESMEAGIVLQGTEVKSIRQGKINLQESYATVDNGEVTLWDCHISPYDHCGFTNHDPKRPRKLLLHKKEILKLFVKLQIKGLTLVPLKVYFTRGKVKVQVGLAKGKKNYDKREDIKRKDMQREMDRAKSAKYS